MENLREYLNSFTKEDYDNKKINLHIHTSYSDGLGNEFQIVQSAKEKRYKLIAITDHNSVEAHKHITDKILLTGVEFDCWYGYVFIHLLAYGIDINHPEIIPFLAKNKKDTEGVIPRLIAKRDVKKLIEAIHQANGIAVLAHPACYWALSLENLVKNLMKIGLDGIETYYPYPSLRGIIKFHTSEEVLKLADKFPQLIKTGGTDFHELNF
jgi:predicted metal-dependent phosphoesterase TrpH